MAVDSWSSWLVLGNCLLLTLPTLSCQVLCPLVPTIMLCGPMVQGCLLVRKEADAMSKGFALGEVLPTAYVELEFPPITTAAAKGACQNINRHWLAGVEATSNPLLATVRWHKSTTRICV
jgi:hypothetical protein